MTGKSKKSGQKSKDISDQKDPDEECIKACKAVSIRRKYSVLIFAIGERRSGKRDGFPRYFQASQYANSVS